ncbi:MAG TPA: PAS domain-containing protein [Gemmatimonadales bacterium]|jgi:PAS domain-containing protein|nr:PAS domain-containing protein [Gemmatimonadales bacterium]
MRDDHRPKQELIHEITGLRKQVLDLKEAMTARRRVEDALRTAETLLRALSDGAPVGLGLFRDDGTLLTANRPFAHMLGYDSPAELQALSAVCGVFASPEDQSRALRSSPRAEAARHALFRRKDGCRRSHPVLAGQRSADREVTLAVFETLDTPNPPFPSPSA